MAIIPMLCMTALKHRYISVLEDEIAEARDRKKAQITLTMRVEDAEVLQWLISSYQVAKASMDMPLEAFKEYPDCADDIIHEMQEEANRKLIHHLQEKNYIRSFTSANFERCIRQISQQLCVVSYPLPGYIQKGE